jgi:hypothetical protein
MRRVTAAFALLSLVALPAAAGDIDQLQNLNQDRFRLLSEDLGSALSYKAVLPAAPLGLSGFDIGVEATATKLQNEAIWDSASSGDSTSTLVIPKIHAHKGLPFGLDLGASYSAIPDTNITLWGAELRYALVSGGVATPALGLRATYSRLSGVEQLKFDTKGLELTISKGFTLFTPYAGIGRVWVVSTPIDVPTLSKEEFGQNKYYVGGNLNFGLINIAIEGDKTGEATSYSAKFGFRF